MSDEKKFIWAIIIVVLFIVVYSGLFRSKDVKHDYPDHLEAYLASKKFVKNNLKAPATAKFPDYLSEFVKSSPDDDKKIIVLSYVDAQNAFGANLRTHYICQLQYLGNSEWRLIDLKFLN